MTTSVIIPLYNKADSIINCINSLIHQIRRPSEVIIVDDQSTDGSFELIESYINSLKTSIKFKLIQNVTNSGPSIARNFGLENANGDLIFFLDADDYFTSTHINTVVDYFISNLNIGVVITSTIESETKLIRPNFNTLKKKKLIKFNSDGILITEDFVKVFCGDPIFCACGNVVILNRIIGDIRFDPLERNFEDWYFFYQICQKIQNNKLLSIAFLPENVGVVYNANDLNSLSRRPLLDGNYHVPSFIEYEFVDFRFRKYIYYNWLFSNLKRTVDINKRLRLFKFQIKNICKFLPPIAKFFLPSIMLLLKIDAIVIFLARLRKKVLYD